MKKAMCSCAKVAFSGVLALMILSVFCFFYDNAPNVIEQPSGMTNYRFEPYYYWFDMTEGFGFGRTNNIGYNDSDDFLEPSDPVIVFLGSSHTEAFQLPQQENFAALTQAKLLNDEDAANDYSCLNLGVANHHLNVTVSNFEYAAEYFENIRYAVIEVNNLQYSVDELERMLNGEYHEPLKKDGMLSKLLERVPVLKIPVLRTIKKQYDRVVRKAETMEAAPVASVDYGAYEEALDDVLAKISTIVAEENAQIIIVYHHPMELDDDGLRKTDDPQLVRIFGEACERQLIHFIDITDRFIAHYQSEDELAYGFLNTAMGEGHLNSVGHRIISDGVYQKICELEKVK